MEVLSEFSPNELELRIPKKRWRQNMMEDLWPKNNPPSIHLADVEIRLTFSRSTHQIGVPKELLGKDEYN
jgi:hypothetical protein